MFVRCAALTVVRGAIACQRSALGGASRRRTVRRNGRRDDRCAV